MSKLINPFNFRDIKLYPGKGLRSFVCIIFVICLTTLSTYAQQITITGTVTSSEDGHGLPGVSVLVKSESSIGTSTDVNGKYTLIVPGSAQVLVFSAIGMVTQEVSINSQTVIDILMETDILEVDEVIVVAYGTSTKEAFTGSAAVIGSRELETRPLTSTISAIEGKTAGVQIISASGQPGSSPEIVIRGVGTLNGSTDPLYVVDGVQYNGALANLNMDDIESMTILKDAASTALYGSRAANGVVLITTKSGKNQDGIKVNASVSYGVVSNGVPYHEHATPGEYYEIMGEAYKNALIDDGSTETEAATEVANSIYNRLGYNPFNVANDQILDLNGQLNPNAQVIAKSLDWYDEMSQQGIRENYTLGISGGTEDLGVYFSTSYLEEEGYIVTSAYDRFTSRLNANYDVNKWLSVGANMNLAMTGRQGPFSAGSSSIVNPFGFARNLGSIYPVYIVDPATGNYILDPSGEKQYDLGEGYSDYGILSRSYSPGRHAIAEARWNSERRETNNLGGRYFGTFNIIPGLKFTVNYGIDVIDYLRKEYENHIVGDGAPDGRYSETRSRTTVKNFNQILSYEKRFASGHNVDVTLGHESYERHYSNASGMKNTLTAIGIEEFNNFATTTELSGYSSDKRTEGYFARLNYNFKDRYYISGSVRRDGSSVFHKDVRWGTFYSVGGSWRITEENFMNNVAFVDNLKLRASYGQVGQDDLNDFYISQARYSLLPNAGDPGIWWSDLGNSLLTWETASNWDISLDFKLFDQILEGSFEYWEKNSSDLLYNLPIPLSEGLNQVPNNVASIVNSGFEINLTANIIRNSDLRWSLSVNATTLKSEITELPEPFINGSKRWEVGKSRYDYFIYDYAGVDPDNGDALYYMYEENVNETTGVTTYDPVLDADGNHETIDDWQDAGKGYVGKNTLPDLLGGINSRLSYKGFELDLLFSYSIGGYILDYGYATMMNEGNYGRSVHPDLLNGWREPGDVTDVPRMENGNTNLNQTMSSRYLTDATYFSLRNLAISYNFQQKFFKDIGIDNMKIYVAGENLFYSTSRKGLNPQYNLAGTPQGNDYNPSKVISAGLKILF